MRDVGCGNMNCCHVLQFLSAMGFGKNKEFVEKYRSG
jgi:hypothetical protein